MNCQAIKLSEPVAPPLQESEGRFHIVADCAPVLFWTAGSDSLCDFVDHQWLAFTGRSLEQEIGNGWVKRVHPNDVERCLETYHSAFDAHRPFEMEFRLQRHDRKYRCMLHRGTPRIDRDGKFMGYVGSAVDVTDQKRADVQLAHLQRLASLGSLAATLAHELRQPLAAIKSNVNVAVHLLDSSNPPIDELREIISDVGADGDRANEVIKRIRDFSTKRKTRVERVRLNSLISDSLLLLAGDALRRGVQLCAELAPELPPVFGDRTQLQQVLINLAINGMDAMANTEAPRYLTFETKPTGDNHVEVAVKDCGSGIEPDVLPHLFEPFFSTKGEGMGLGLSLAKSIVESHRGRIWVENNSCGGAMFRFTVPVVAEQARER